MKRLCRTLSCQFRSVPARLALLRRAFGGSAREAATAAERAEDLVARQDMWNADFWFDKAAARVLRWYLSDEPVGLVNFTGTKWQDCEVHGLTYSLEAGVEQSLVFQRGVLSQILHDLELDPDQPLMDSPVELDLQFAPDGYVHVEVSDEDEFARVRAREREILDLKVQARADFAELVPRLWD